MVTCISSSELWNGVLICLPYTFSFNTSSKLPGPMEVAFLSSFFIGSISLSFPIFSSHVCHMSHFQCGKSPEATLTTRHRERWTHLRWETRVPAGSQAHHCLGSSWLEREQCASGPQPQTPSLGRSDPAWSLIPGSP